MPRWNDRTARTVLTALVCSIAAVTAEESDWRLELLKIEGISSETAALQKLAKSFETPTEMLDPALARLSAADFATRAQAQREILQMGKKVLPMLRQLPPSAEPEVRQRLLAIERELEPGGRWARNDLLQHAVSSLLDERLKPGAPAPAEMVFAEFFEHPTPSLKNGYQRFRFLAAEGTSGCVVDGVLKLKGNHADDADQRLILDAKTLTGKETFPDTLRIEVKLGAEAGGEGGYHVGVSIGNVRALFHPGHPSGGFRFQRVDTQVTITENTPLGFDPEVGELQRMSITVKQLPNNNVELVAVVGNGEKTFTARTIVEESVIGKLNLISLDRSGREGGNAQFDDLVVELGTPAR